MNESESNCSPDSTGAKSENSSMQLDADMYATSHIQKLPDFTFVDYLKFIEPLSFRLEAKTGIFHLVPMIQSAHESRNGNSGLARNYGNLFGITATDSWKRAGKPSCNLQTWEVIGGKRVEMKREFRAYDTWTDSFTDWAGLITGLSVYKKAYELLKDKATVPDGLKAMGLVYATDPTYAYKLLSIYESVIKEGIT